MICFLSRQNCMRIRWGFFEDSASLLRITVSAMDSICRALRIGFVGHSFFR